MTNEENNPQASSPSQASTPSATPFTFALNQPSKTKRVIERNITALGDNEPPHNSKRRRTEDENIELVSGFERNKVQSLVPKEVKKPLVIPALANATARLRKPGFIPDETSQPSSSTAKDVPPPTILSNVGQAYGLQITKRKEVKASVTETEGRAEKEETITTIEEIETVETLPEDLTPEEALERKALKELREESNRATGGEGFEGPSRTLVVPMESDSAFDRGAADDTEKYRQDVASRPDECTLADYERVPVEEFGAAALRGMGWKEGKAFGRNPQNALVAPIEFVQRPSLLGLGAQPSAPPDTETKNGHKRLLKPGESRSPKPDLIAAPHADGRARHYKHVGEELVQRNSRAIVVSSEIAIVSGRHKGLAGTVSEICKSDENGRTLAYVRLRGSNEEVRVDVRDLELDKNKNTGNTRHASGERRGEEWRDGRRSSSSRDDDRNGSNSRNFPMAPPSSAPPKGWLVPHIRVKIISKTLEHGKHYYKKAIILDVVQRGLCVVRTDEGRVVEDVHDTDIETVVGSVGDRVMVVGTSSRSTAHRGQTGKILEKDRDKERVSLQLDSNFEIVRLSFDEVAAYSGVPRD